MCQFQLFIALCDHNLPTLQTDGQTDRQTDVTLEKRDAVHANKLCVKRHILLTIFTGKELDSVTEMAGHAAVEYTNTCLHPGVRP